MIDMTKLIQDARAAHIFINDLEELGFVITIATNDEDYVQFIDDNYDNIEVERRWLVNDVEYEFGIKIFYSDTI